MNEYIRQLKVVLNDRGEKLDISTDDFGPKTLAAVKKHLAPFALPDEPKPDPGKRPANWPSLVIEGIECHPFFAVPAPYTHPHPFDYVAQLIGNKEISGKKDNPLIAHSHEHCKNLGHHSDKNDYHDETPNCSSGLNLAADACGCEKSDHALASSWDGYDGEEVKDGEWIEVGDIVRIAHPGGHVFLCAKRVYFTRKGKIKGLGWNQGNSIKLSEYSLKDIKAVHKWKPKPGTNLAPIGTLKSKLGSGETKPGESTR